MLAMLPFSKNNIYIKTKKPKQKQCDAHFQCAQFYMLIAEVFLS